MSDDRFQTLQLEQDGPVTWARLHRPARLNALTEESFRELAAALRVLAGDGRTRVLVLSGAGRGFCSGSDVDGMRERLEWEPARQVERLGRLGREVVRALYDLPVPTVAALNGPASGGGLSLALACDLRVACETATIACGYTGVGLIPDLGATYFLPRVMGLSRACRFVWTNGRLTAAAALALGLVDEVAPNGEFTARVSALARELAEAPALAVRLGRAALRAGLQRTLDETLDAEAQAQALCLHSADHRARVQAFVSRRPVHTQHER